MSDPTVLPRADVLPRSRWKGKLLVIAALLVAVPAGFYAYVTWRDREALAAAITEADRLDPGWRMDELEANRQAVPDAENGANTVLVTAPLVPPNWSSPTVDAALRSPGLEFSLDGEAEWMLNTDLAPVTPAVTEARKLADRPRGRYTVPRAPVCVAMTMGHLQVARSVARLLQADALRRAQDEDLRGALISCRAALNAGRSIGDEPFLISMLVRLACASVALDALERTLAHGTVPAADLLAFQRLLEDEASEPLQLVAARGERATLDDLFDAVQSGKITGDELLSAFAVARTAVPVDSLQMQLFLGDKGRRANVLRQQTRLVEIAKLPVEQRPVAVNSAASRNEFEGGPTLLVGLLEPTNGVRLTEPFLRGQARLRCGIALLAVERFRCDHGRWPESLAELCPAYLATAPLDPFNGKPLRLRRVTDGVIVYSVGPDLTDDGGKLDRRKRAGAKLTGADIGYQLWDTEKRRQPAVTPLAGPPRPDDE